MILLFAGCHAYLDLPGDDRAKAGDTAAPDSDGSGETGTPPDTGCDVLWFADADADGFGDATSGVDACVAPEGYVGDATDCDDADAGVSPGSEEDCTNLRDDDCDGATDEECPGCDTLVPTDVATIQAAIDAAVDGEVVCVLSGTYEETLDFLGKAIEVVGVEGAEATTLDANGAGSTVSFVGGEGAGTVLSGFTLTGGVSNLGGCVRVEGGGPTLKDLVLTGCQAPEAWGGGGGMYLDGATSSISRVEIKNCTAENGFGGGIRIEGGSVVLDDVTLHDNFAHYYGGGLYVVEGVLTFTGGTVEANAVEVGYGGGIWLDSVSIALSSITIADNSGKSEAGGLYALYAEGTLHDVTMTGNSASSGSGGGAEIQRSPLALTRVSVTDNSASGGGGGLLLNESSIVATDLEVSGNWSGSGGALSIEGGAPAFDGLEVADNQNSGIYVREDADVSVVNAWITGNQGSGLVADGAGLVAMANTVVAGNTSSSWASGLYFRDSPATLDNVVVLGNAGSGSWGASMLLAGETTDVTVTNSAFVGNDAMCGGATGCCGAGVGTYDAVGDLRLDRVIVSHNAGQGVCLESTAASTSISSTDVYDNGADAYFGIDSPTGADGNVEIDPVFLDTTSADPTEWDLHLATTSSLVDAVGDSTDSDGSAGDIGVYSGTYGATWDLDGDGYPAWWQPGAYDTSAYPSAGWDCDDADETVYPGAGC
ncbi:MAG: right-handed parallel beta-helix repeat-containing protein [Myxococcota bacterium]